MKPRVSLTQKQIEWLTTVGWKNYTITELAKQENVSVTQVHKLFKSHGIEAITRRDQITKELLKLYDPNVHMEVKAMSIQLGCSQQLIKEIIEDYDLRFAPPPEPAQKKQPEVFTGQTQKRINQQDYIKKQVAKLEAQKKRAAEIKLQRAAYTIYNQTGSPILDDLRNIKTTKREKTLNNG